MGLFVNPCDDPLYGLLDNGDIDPSVTLDNILSCGETAETRETGAVEPAPVETPEARSSEAASAADRLRAMTAPGTDAATSMHPEGTPRYINFGAVNVDAWEIEGSEYAGYPSGYPIEYGPHHIPYSVLHYDGRTFLVNDAQGGSSHSFDTILRIANQDQATGGHRLVITNGDSH